MSASALQGVRVLDLSRILAGPVAAQLLADCGADVIKVERPEEGDDARRLGGAPLRNAKGEPLNTAPMFLCANRNKRSIALDIARPEGQELIRRLAAKSDVLIENYKTGDLARHGLDYASLSVVNPRLVYCSITGFGQTGPYASRVGFDPVFQAMSGLMSATGLPDDVPGGGPMRVGVPIADYICGVYAYGAILTALYHRDNGGGAGQHIDLALLDTTLAAMSSAGANFLVNGIPETRNGMESATTVPSRIFDCADGKLQISAPNDEMFRRLCAILGCSNLARDLRFETKSARLRHRQALTEALAPNFLRQPRAALIAALEEAKVPCAPIHTLSDAYADPQVMHRGGAVTVTHPAIGSFRMAANPIKFSRTPIGAYDAPPLLGEHTEHVLREILDLSDVEIADLKDRHVI
ncbi:MAG: CoA transferase [Rhodocyclaceae bacterium]|nr:CoA transferase [Rhodocyclaceae bacterium]